MKRLLLILALICWAPPLMLTPLAQAAFINWDGSEGTSWADGLNWVGDSVPGAADIAGFDNDTSSNSCVVDESVDVLGITLDNYTGTLDLGDSAYAIAIGTSGFLIDKGTVDLGDAVITITGGPFNYLQGGGGAWTTGTGGVTLVGDCVVTGDYAQQLYGLTLSPGDGSEITINSSTNLRVVVTGTCTINGEVVLDDVLAVTGDGNMVINEGASFSGAKYIHLMNSTSGHGLTTLHSSVTAPETWVQLSVAGARLAAGTYGGLVKIRAYGGNSTLLELDSFATYGAYIFAGGLEFENFGTDLVTLDNSTNDPTINVTTVTIDLDSTGNIVIDDDGAAVDWNVSGNWVDEVSGGGSFTFTQGTGTYQFTGTGDQVIGSATGGGLSIGTWDINKTTSGEVAVDNITMVLGAVDMVGDGDEALVIGKNSGCTITSTADPKNFVGASANDADVDVGYAGNDINLGSATWTITNGDFDFTNCGTFADETSTVVLNGTGNLLFKSNQGLYRLTVFAAAATTVPAASGSICRINNLLTVNGTISVASDTLTVQNPATLSVGSAGSITGNGSLRFVGAGTGITAFTVGSSSIDIANVLVYWPTATGAFVATTWDCATLFKVQNTTNATKTWDPSGTQTFNCPVEFENMHADGILDIDGTNNPSWVFTDNVVWDETAGSIRWVNKSTGSITASTIAKLGGCFRFNGSSDEVDINTQLHDFATDFTIAAWIRMPSLTTATNRMVFSQGGHCQLFLGAGGRLYYLTNAGDYTFTDTGVFSANTWHHVMVTYDTSGTNEIVLYVNNATDPAWDEDKTAANTAADSRIGGYLGNLYWFRGHIDDVRIFDKALSVAERAALYNGGDGTTDDVAPLSCLAKYTFDEFAGNTTVADSSGNTETGTATQNTNIMSATPKDWDFDGQTIEDIIVNTTAGTLTHGGGWVSDSYSQTAGSVDFGGQTVRTIGDFSVAIGSTFASGGAGLDAANISVGGNFTARGTPTTLLDMTAANWTLDVTGSAYCWHANVTNSDAGPGNTVIALGSTDGGGNLNWLFMLDGAGGVWPPRPRQIFIDAPRDRP